MGFLLPSSSWLLKLPNVRTTKATTVLNAGSLRMSAPPIFFHVIAYSCNSVVFFVMLKRSSLCVFAL